jgi:2-(1,2-epoxy-1,2-dihydrophenyl)acetyl-CoA isomerase
MDTNLVLLDKSNGIATITLNQPETLNALTYDMLLRLHQVVDEISADKEVRTVILTGAGRGFCSGANLLGGSAEALSAGGMGVRSVVLKMNAVLTGIAKMEKPWLAAVNGPAVGGGCSLALVCDLALMAESAFMSVGYVNVGLVPDMGMTYMLTRLVGFRKASEIALFGERVYGPEAVELGLANRAVPDKILMERTTEWAERLANGPTLAIGAIKLGLRRALHGTLRDTLYWEAMMLPLILQTEDASEGLMAFFQKREPEFKGK